MSEHLPIVISPAPPSSADARAVTLGYYAELVGRYHGRAATAAEIRDVDADDDDARLDEPHGFLLLARRGEQVVGCAGLRIVTDAGADSGADSGAVPGADPTTAAGAASAIGEVTRVFVDASARGLGVARLLLAALEAEARARGLSALRLDTRSDLVEARSLYAAVGFIEGPAHNADPYAEHWFRKQLDD